jgi:pimeloyl-ACP methyl ester carboxylesterase
MKTRLLITLISLGMFLAGCADSAASPTPTETAPQPTVIIEPTPTAEPTIVIHFEPTPTALPTPEPVLLAYEPTFVATSCPFALPPDEVEGETIMCGYVTVPEDRRYPEDVIIRLAVVIFKAQSVRPLPDPVILLAGGPGEKVVRSALDVSLILAPFRDSRDLIVFDQRGVGLSEPALECPELVDSLFDTLDELDSEAVLQKQFDATMSCRDRLVAEGFNLSAYNTAENAADVEDIRRALGYEQLNLYGGSYGTLLAQAVMRDHPQGIRSVVMGAVLPADKSFFVHVPSTIVIATLDLLAACAADAACNEAYPDLQQTLYDTIDRLNAEPVPIEVTNPLDGQSYDSWLTGDSVFGNLVLFLYITDIIPVLPQAIHDVANEDYELMTRLTSTSLALIDGLSRGMEYSVFCAEDLIGVTPEEYLEKRLEMPRPLAGSADPEDIIAYSFFGICENWPVEQADPVLKEPVVSDIPTLILEGEFDPVTPLVYAEQVAKHLANSYLYEFPGIGHNILLGSACARSISDQFLDDPTSEPDASCIAEMPGVVFDLPQVEPGEVVLEPLTYAEIGLNGVGPTDWERAAPGTFVRGQNALDSTALIIDALPLTHSDFLELIVARLGLDEPLESAGERETDSFVWTLYAVEVQGIAIDIAATAGDEQSTLMVLMQSAPDEHQSLYETVFLPAVDSLVPLE